MVLSWCFWPPSVEMNIVILLRHVLWYPRHVLIFISWKCCGQRIFIRYKCLHTQRCCVQRISIRYLHFVCLAVWACPSEITLVFTMCHWLRTDSVLAYSIKLLVVTCLANLSWCFVLIFCHGTQGAHSLVLLLSYERGLSDKRQDQMVWKWTGGKSLSLQSPDDKHLPRRRSWLRWG